MFSLLYLKRYIERRIQDPVKYLKSRGVFLAKIVPTSGDFFSKARFKYFRSKILDLLDRV